MIKPRAAVRGREILVRIGSFLRHHGSSRVGY
jgi:hypothetical protein